MVSGVCRGPRGVGPGVAVRDGGWMRVAVRCMWHPSLMPRMWPTLGMGSRSATEVTLLLIHSIYILYIQYLYTVYILSLSLPPKKKHMKRESERQGQHTKIFR